LAGKRAECDGGYVSGGLASREDFAGTLSGEYIEEGDPPWRWYYLHKLTKKPEDYDDEGVWCETGFLFVMDE
jgi:hypothetical protein